MTKAELFDIIHQDPYSWLGQAKQLRLAANAILPCWEAALLRRPSEPGTQEKMLAYSEAFMMLTGLAFENLFKGILYGRNPEHSLAKSDGGHGIVKMASGISSLAVREQNLLERLKLYLIWAGRYPLPMKVEKFISSQGQVSIRTDDPLQIDQLFNRFAQILSDERQARSSP